MSNIINTTNVFLNNIMSDPDKYTILIHDKSVCVYNSETLELMRKISINSFLEFILSELNISYEFV